MWMLRQAHTILSYLPCLLPPPPLSLPSRLYDRVEMKGIRQAAIAAVAGSASFATGSNVISLVGDKWILRNPNGSVLVPAQLPSQAHLDLYAAQVIGDPYHGLNEFDLRWVVDSNWTYISNPIYDLSSDEKLSTWLLFDGLDTFATITFAEAEVASTNNQFRQYWFDVSSILAQSNGTDGPVLSLNFGSAPSIANEIAAQPGQETWPKGVQLVYEFPNRWFVRKEQSDFGWDWGPAFAPAGPWKPAYVVQLAEGEVHVRNSVVDIYREGQRNLLPPDQTKDWVVNASLDYFGSALDSGVGLTYRLTTLENTTVRTGSLGDVNVTDATVTGSTIIPADTVDLWWPSQLGPQTLYYLTIDVVPANANGKPLASVTKRVGFRTIVLNETPISDEQLAQGIAPGNNWHFEINGHEFYAKGSNFIPPDAFWPRVTPDRINKLFNSVIDGNQNMLRVWASGAYSPDFMYDLADEKGILLWSEFQFGDALYPVDEAFLDNVREEAIYQVRRCNHHPSLALWAGGNELENLELEALLAGAAPEQLARYTAEYEQLFLGVLLPAVFGNSRSISYTPSSTSNGWLSLNFSNPIPIKERYLNLTEGSVYGETDFYNYDPAVLGDNDKYPVGRFSNEFGYHSMPSLQSWRQQVSESDLSFNSSVITLRDHHLPPSGLNTSAFDNANVGQGQMTMAVQLWYPTPNKADPIANFSSWIYATQVFQADLYVSEIAFYRRGSGLPNRQLGSLYWQLEDIWVAPSWAGIEYDGRWKLLHYAAKDIYKHVIIAPYYNRTTGNLSVWVTSDLWEPIKGTATFEWYDWHGNKLPIDTTSPVDFTVGAINSTQVLQGFTTELLKGYNPADVVLYTFVTATGSTPNSNTTQTFTHEHFFHPAALKDAALVDPGLALYYSNMTQKFSVTATTGVAAWVWLDYPAGAVLSFESNGFWLLPGRTREVGYTVQNDTTGGKWKDGVTVQSIWNLTLAE
ncbi:Beta-mannosidase A-like [Teratosphaeria destructans]|uniref:Beta-mannosidase A n=1 Tax=Teratosphaeria destructans TaxID=418781 RepID=A0A9W7SJU8_9PEZI|nr:Beta-mannosidase A-like [Teratosphaeria destructans]